MSLLNAGDLSRMRTTAGAALPDTAVIQSSTFVSDGGGGGTMALTASGTIDCRIAPMGGQSGMGSEEEVGERLSPEANFIVTLPYNASISTEKQLVINGGTFNVEAVRDRSWPLTKRVEASRAT